MSTAFLFYFHITLTGVVIAAASTYFAALMGAPAPRLYPVLGEKGGIGSAVTLWLLSGPISLMRVVVRTFSAGGTLSFWSMGALAGAFVWAFCLGVLTLELIFRLFQG